MNILPFCSSKEMYSSKVKETGQVILLYNLFYYITIIYINIIFNTLNLYGMLKLLFICTDDTFYLRGEN